MSHFYHTLLNLSLSLPPFLPLSLPLPPPRFLEAEGLEKTSRFKQEDIAAAVPLASSQQVTQNISHTQSLMECKSFILLTLCSSTLTSSWTHLAHTTSIIHTVVARSSSEVEKVIWPRLDGGRKSWAVNFMSTRQSEMSSKEGGERGW